MLQNGFPIEDKQSLIDLTIKHWNVPKYILYRHLFPDGKSYIGITSQTAELRWGRKGINYKSQKVYQKIQEFGWDNIKHIILKQNIPQGLAPILEKQAISYFDSFHNGYNEDEGKTKISSWRNFFINKEKVSLEDELEDKKVLYIYEHNINRAYRTLSHSGFGLYLFLFEHGTTHIDYQYLTYEDGNVGEKPYTLMGTSIPELGLKGEKFDSALNNLIKNNYIEVLDEYNLIYFFSERPFDSPSTEEDEGIITLKYALDRL